MSRTPFIAGNWKLNKTVAESLALVTELKNALASVRDVEVAVAPVFTALQAVGKRLEGTSIALAAQNCHWEDQGAFTGEVSVPLLKDVGCSYVIVGHSERRQLFGELDAGVNLKARAVLKHGLKPIICVGETDKERDAGETMGRVGAQLEGALKGISKDEMRRVVIAYEPVWAIGTGRTATNAQAQEVHAFIRGKLREQYAEVADEVRIQYGGSVKPDNVAGLMAEPDIDGALVGGASLTAESFIKLVRYKR
ncbi:MAG TPA: triose-phosphate isomerase [Polyangia bacterium]|jgi:triosephosphate isomerase